MNIFNSINLKDALHYFYLNFRNPYFIIISILDISLVSYLIYKIFVIIKDTRAWQLIKGIVIIFVIAWISKLLGLTTISYIFDNVITIAAISIVVLFQKELRRGLEQLGKNKFNKLFVIEEQGRVLKTTTVIEELLKAVTRLSKSYIGGLIVIEREVTIEDIAKSGVIIDSTVNAELIVNIFTPNTPLHDGAIVVRDNKIRAASCLLPLTDNPDVGRNMGTRHRAALGISEACDCIVIVVSEESGNISYVRNGSLIGNLKVDTLRKILGDNLIEKEVKQKKIKSKKEQENE